MTIKILIIFFITFNSAFAELKKTKVQTNIESDKLIITKKNHTSIFTGNVKLFRENLKIYADKIIVIQFKNKITNKTKIKYIEAFGKQATLMDLNDDGEELNAFANKIYYNQNSNLIKLLGDAKLTTEEDTFISQVIWYNKKTKKMQAGKITDEKQNKTSRVQITFIEDEEDNK